MPFVVAGGKRIAMCALTIGLVMAGMGCFEITKYAVQHSAGARLTACHSSKDSVEAVLGKPYWRYFSDAEFGGEGLQLFWHEWGYRIRADSSRAARPSDNSAATADSVKVVGFLWGDGLQGCSVRERRVRKGTHPSVPWEGAGDVPRVPF
ncbi:MAG: hypothetical protein ACR2L6_00010 [Gemmatimonadaceae bacterium]